MVSEETIKKLRLRRRVLIESEVRQLLEVMVSTGRPATIDWYREEISVQSAEYEHKVTGGTETLRDTLFMLA